MAKQDLHLPDTLDGRVWQWSFHHRPRRQVHRHDELEFNLVLSGAGAYIVDSRRYDLARGSLIWLFPEQDHILIDETRDMTMWIAVFKPDMLRRLVGQGASPGVLAGRPDGAFCHMLAESAVAPLDALAEQASQCESDRPTFNAALALIAMMGWRLHEHAEESPPGADVHPAVQRAVSLIRADPVHADLHAVALRAGLSISRLSRLFKQQTGMALVAFRQRQRLRRFTELYGRGRRRNVTQAALEAGFGSYPQFHRVFKQVYGVSPRQYRRDMA